VVVSYRQTVRAYPSGGGSYIVSKDNLGTLPALVAAAALLVDYVLTVSVSVVAGVVAIVGAAGGLSGFTVELSLGFVVLLTVANLRGVKETGALFAFPTYAFVVSILSMLAVGLTKCAVSGCPSAAGQHVQAISDLARHAGPLSLFVILHAFSSGSTALTGVEAISNGVPAFKRPQSKNAATTLGAMGLISITMFLGISFLATHMEGLVPPGAGQRSVDGQIAFSVFGGGFGFYAVQVFTAAILILAANTSYQDFPRLSSILAHDRYMPRQFANWGDRLVFSNGIIVLAVLSGLLIWGFAGDLDKLIQLYVVGVFTAFTLSQAGMVRHWSKIRAEGGRAGVSIAINAIGAVCTGVVLIIITATKFTEGAWISITAMAVIIVLFQRIHRHYSIVGRQLRQRMVSPRVPANHGVLLVPDIDAATAEALGYVRGIHPTETRAVYLSPTAPSEEFLERWEELCRGALELERLPATDGNLLAGVRTYLTGVSRGPGDFASVVLPELIEEASLSHVLKHRDLFRLKSGLLRERRIAVTDVPVVTGTGEAAAGGEVALVPQRLVALVFISGVHDASVRAVNYARSLQAADTRAVYFALDPHDSEKVVEDWFDRRPGIRLDVLEAPFRDLSGPMLTEVRRYTARPDTVVALIIPELIPRRLLHYPLHRQTALFVKRLFLFEESVILTSVPYHLD
jgi:amino acid transporter